MKQIYKGRENPCIINLQKTIFLHCSMQQVKAPRNSTKRNGTRLQRGRLFARAPMTCTLHTINIIKRLDYGCTDTMR